MNLPNIALGGALAAAIATLASGPASAAVDSDATVTSGWDYQGSDVFTKQSKNFSSGGGNFRICLTSGSKTGFYRVMEEDPFDPDDYVSDDGKLEVHFPGDFTNGGCFTYHHLDRFRDGANNQAEFYVVKWTGGNSTVKAYD